MKNLDLKSSVGVKGKYVTQIIHFIGGEKRTFHDVNTQTIQQGQFTKFETKDGRMILVNDKKVICIEIFETQN